MFKHWNLNLSREAKFRLLTSVCIVVGLVIAFSLRMLTEWIFDVFIFLFAIVAVIDIIGAKKLGERGVRSYYVFAYLVISYTMFIFVSIFGGEYAFWVHLGMQILAVGLFALYTFLMNYTDKEFEKQARLKKSTLGRECRHATWEFIKVAIYPSLMLFCLVPLNHMGVWANVELVGLFSLLLVFVISCFTDTFAYIVGMIAHKVIKRFGKEPKKMCPKISPKKTWAGTIGGLFGGVIGTMVLLLIFSASTNFSNFMTDKIGYSLAVQLTFICIGIVGSIINQAGDIYASWLKRKVGIKDFGKYLPGHGGAMDRLDGISWNAVFVFITMMIITFVC